MPRIKGRAEQQRHFRCESSRDRGKTEAVLYVLFYLSFFFFFFKGRGRVDTQKLPKCTANICTDLVFDGL